MQFGDATAVDTSATFNIAGSYVLQLRADDGQYAPTATVTIVVLAEPDIQVPQVQLTAPTDGATVTGTVLVQATASDNAGVASVSFSVDSTSLGTDTTPPYEVNWDTSTYINGGYTVTALATDTSGLTAMSSVNVTVDHPPPVNVAPQVEAGGNQTIRLPVNMVNLDGTVSDDGLPTTVHLTTEWSDERAIPAMCSLVMRRLSTPLPCSVP